MHGNFPKRVEDKPETSQSKVDPVDVVMRLARDLKGQGVKVVVLGNIQLEFFESVPSARIADVRESTKQEPIDLDTYHLE